MDDPTSTIKDLLPQPASLEIAGETIVVRPFAFDQMPVILPKMSALMSLIDNGAAAVILAGPALLGDLQELLALATGRSKEWIQGLDAGAGIELTTVVAEQNEGFFHAMLAALPRLVAVMDRLAKAVPTGATSRRT